MGTGDFLLSMLSGEESVKLDVFTTFGEMAQAAVIKAVCAKWSVLPLAGVCSLNMCQTQPFLFAATGGASAPSTSSTFILEVSLHLTAKSIHIYT